MNSTYPALLDSPALVAARAPRPSLLKLCWIFLRIAATSFGGHMAMVSAMQNMLVDRLKLLSHRDMLDGISLASVLPGPLAINTVAYAGYRLHGKLGAFVCVACALAPGFILMVLLTTAYFHWNHLPEVSAFFKGLTPAVAALIAAAAWNMQKQIDAGRREAALTGAAALAMLCIGGIFTTVGVTVAAGMLGLWWFGKPGRLEDESPSVQPEATSAAPFNRYASVASAVVLMACIGLTDSGELLKLFGVFAGMGMLMFGGAYVFIPMLQHTATAYGWVTQQELTDAIAMAQMMPGPIVVSAAFIGFKAKGLAGALAATAGIVLPSAAMMVFCAGALERIKDSPAVAAVFRGVRAAVVGMVLACAVSIAQTAAPHWMSVVLFLAAFIAAVRLRIDAIWIILPAGFAGLLVY